jgi:hypothetical protein
VGRRARAAMAVADGGPVNLDRATIPDAHQYEEGTSAAQSSPVIIFPGRAVSQ